MPPTLPALAAATPTASRMRQAAAPVLFLILGIVFATWAARIPAIRDALALSPATLSLVLLGCGIGAVASFPLASWLIGKHGARRAAWYCGLALILLLPTLAAAPNMASLMTLMVGFGASQTSFNVCINAVGAKMEVASGRSMMSRLHAWYCVGSFAGAIFGSVMASSGVPAQAHFVIAALIMAALLWASCRALPHVEPDASARKKQFAWPRGPLVALGVICFCVAVAEGTITDWSGVYMRDQLRTSEGMAPMAFAAFSAMMLGARLIADGLKDRFGARRVVSVGALAATVGVALMVAAHNVPTTIGGFALAGGGLAAVFPFIFSAAARRGATELAGVATMGYSGILIGPPIVGFIANAFGLQAAVALVGVLTGVITVAAYHAKWLD
jgi:predicted MFS family arabinose efflux permease